MAEKHHVVVDGSNLATEGRTSPSLAQLDDAVKAYAQEDPTAEIVVVVDATFGHRIDAAERDQFEQAELHGELVSPPAGAIGRGDAFVLRIAERTGATVLSNDSFQEFHAEHPWLFDVGRLVGGKPVPGVGWIFTPRTPVRGPRSREVTGKSKKEDRTAELPAPVKAAELARAARKASARRAADGSAPKVGDVREAPAPKPSTKAKKVASPKMAEPAPVRAPKPTTKKGSPKKHAKPSPAELAAEPAKPAKKTKAGTAAEKTKAQAPASGKPTKVAKAAAGAANKANAAAPSAVAEVKSARTTKLAKAAKSTKAIRATKAAKSAKPGEATKRAPGVAAAPAAKRAATKKKANAALAEIPAAGTSAPAGGVKPAKRPRKGSAAQVSPVPTLDPAVLEAIHQATAEALSPPSPKAKADGKAGKQGKGGGKGGAKRRRSAPPPPAVNEPLPFISFVAAYPLGSEVEGEVASFTSHGAMVDVGLPDGESLHCYIPLTGLGDPPPRKAREVLSRGQRRSFVLVGLDPSRRVAELALPGTASELAVSSGS